MQTLQEYKCPCCGGAIAFDSTLQKMKCPYCDTEFEMEALEGYDAELQSENLGRWRLAGGRNRRPALVCVQVLRRRDRRRCQHSGYCLPLLRQSRGDDGPVLRRSQAGSCDPVQAG